MKAVHPLNQVFVHMSGDNNMYAWAFADWLIEGEENTANYHARRASDPTLPENYTRILDVPKVASRYSPFAFGDKFFLYQFWGWKNSEPAGTSVGPAVHPRRHHLGRGRAGQQAGARRPGMGREGGVRSVLAQGDRHPRDLARPARDRLRAGSGAAGTCW